MVISVNACQCKQLVPSLRQTRHHNGKYHYNWLELSLFTIPEGQHSTIFIACSNYVNSVIYFNILLFPFDDRDSHIGAPVIVAGSSSPMNYTVDSPSFGIVRYLAGEGRDPPSHPHTAILLACDAKNISMTSSLSTSSV